MAFVPYVIEQSGRSERVVDIYSRLLSDRIVFVGEAIDEHSGGLIVAQLLFLESSDPEKPINMYINSPGGAVSAGLAIYDTMQYINSPVYTYCIGQASSMAAVLLAAGEKGNRFALPHSRIMIHQPLGGFQGQASDIEIHAREIIRIKEEMANIMATHTGVDVKRLMKDMDRDFFMSATEANKYGIIDAILMKRQEK